MMTALTEGEVDLLLEDYCNLEVGGHTTVSYPVGTLWANVNAEFAARGLKPMVDYVLQGTDAAYDGVVTFSMSRLTDKEPGLRSNAPKKKKAGTGRPRGAPSQFDKLLEDAIIDLLTGKTKTLELSSGWQGEKRQEAYATTTVVLSAISGNT